jgi:lipid-A-disaccharide synthase
MAQAALPFRFAPPAAGGADLLIVAGEHSGDENAARLVRGLREIRTDLRLCALGGARLAEAGVQVLFDPTASSVIGYGEVIRRYFSYFRPLFQETVRWIREHRPRTVCLVDYGGFNLRLANALREEGLSSKGGGPIRVVYYISPQIWASRARRRFVLARSIDAMAVIFPFEPACYADTALPVDFVGHPFVASDYRPPVRYDPSGPVLLLPGSRRKPVERIFPALVAGYRAAGVGRPAAAIYPSEDIAAVLRGVLGSGGEGIALLPGGGPEPVGASAVLTSSGTMSVHCALAGIPGAIAYRTDALTYLLGRWLVRVRYLGLANLLLGEPMYPEHIQGEATAGSLADELRACLSDPARLERTRSQAERLRTLLSRPTGGTAADWLSRQCPVRPANA